jgi:hypothetical protein
MRERPEGAAGAERKSRVSKFLRLDIKNPPGVGRVQFFVSGLKSLVTSVVPPGLDADVIRYPALKALGYHQTSLRDYNEKRWATIRGPAETIRKQL